MNSGENAKAAQKVRQYRQRLRGQGLRPVQIWVPDERASEFHASLRRQVAQLDAVDEADTLEFIESAADKEDG
ncbi:MAG: antitoxin MazE family protein [Opitutales bacterium]|nr:antitoxin MazE family protein [Opitutales bacterium]